MYFAAIVGENGPVGDVVFSPNRDSIAKIATELVHSYECKPGMSVLVGESPAITVADLDAMDQSEVTIFGALNRINETGVAAGDIPGWMWAPTLRYRGGYPGYTNPEPPAAPNAGGLN